MNTVKYYAEFLGKYPRKRQPNRISVPLESKLDTQSIYKFIKENGIRDVGTVALNAYRVDETSFKCTDGTTETIVFKALFPQSSERLELFL